MPMMTQQLGFSVLTAPIASLDRRALSQAWYSALHLVRGRAAAIKETPVKPHVRLQPPCHEVHAARTQLKHFGERAPANARREVSADRACVVPADRRATRSPLARKIERLFLHPGVAARRATFTLEGSGVRVHVSMQTGKSGMRLVAVCPPHARAAVSRALNEARYALAARGIALDARVSE